MFYIKLILTLVWFALTSVITIIVGIIRWKNPSGGYVFGYLFTRGVKLITGVNVDITNAQRLMDSQPCVYVGNHQSNIDMLVQANCYRPNTVCIGKKEILWIPFFGLLFYVTGNILLDRKNHDKAMQGMDEARRFLQDRKISVYMFPEGTRNKFSEDLLPFKRGAFYLAISAQVPIQPVVSCKIVKFFDMKNRVIRTGTAKIEVLEPISTKGMVATDVDKLLELTRDRMQEAYKRLNSQI